MERNKQSALIIVDEQRGFMPASEGDRLRLPGFGELAVAGAEAVIAPTNRLTAAYRRNHFPVLTTQDFHPHQTAHFSDEPNYTDTWPVHCVGGTSGAELHPDLIVSQIPGTGIRFIKGDIACTSPSQDTSYTGALAYDPTTGTTLPDWLRNQHINTVTVVGVAIGDGDKNKLCADSTAADMRDLGFDVTVVTDAVEAVHLDQRELCFRNLGARGIRLVTADEHLAEISATTGSTNE